MPEILEDGSGVAAAPGFRILLLAALPLEARPFLRQSQARPLRPFPVSGLRFPVKEKGIAGKLRREPASSEEKANIILSAENPGRLSSLPPRGERVRVRRGAGGTLAAGLPETALPAWEFRLGQGRGGLLLTGMGQEAAGAAAARLLNLYQPATIISFGFGGALLPGLSPGGVVLGASCRRYDPAAGSLEEIKAPGPPRALEELEQHLKGAGLPAAIGSIVSTPGIIHKGRQGGPLQGLKNPVLDLETAAVAAAAKAAGLPFLALRAITDGPGEEIPEFLRQGCGPAPGPGPMQALAWLARDPRRLQDLLRLWWRSRLAAARLAAALGVILPLI